jgi:hypothetical protein
MSNKKSTTCLECQVVFIPKSGSTGKFCCQSCAAKFNNRGRVNSLESRLKVSETLKKKNLTPLKTKSGNPAYCRVSWCKVCNGVIRHDHKLTCSVECNNKHRSKTHIQSKLTKPVKIAKEKPVKIAKVILKEATNQTSSKLYPHRKVGARKLASLYLNKNSDDITYTDIELLKNYLNIELHTNNLSPAQIANKLGHATPHIHHIIYGIGLKTKDVKTAVNNTKRQLGLIRTDEKYTYYKECEFNLTRVEMEKIPGFSLLIEHGIFHPVQNPNGAVKDHILSRAEAYQYGYDPAHIRHPANCRFITNMENLKKSSSSDITYEELLERIRDWENNIVPTLSTIRRPVQKTPEHIEKIRQSTIAYYEKVKSGEIISTRKNSIRIGRKPTFHTKYDWEPINEDVRNGMPRKDICKKHGITIHTLNKAKLLRLVIAHPKIK